MSKFRFYLNNCYYNKYSILFRSYFFESNDVMTNVPLYSKIVQKIVNDIKTNDLGKIPCFINTMGFVEGIEFKYKFKNNIYWIIYFDLGPGLNILHNLISVIKPSDVIQLKYNESQNLNLHSEVINDNTKSSLSYNLWYFVSNVKNKFAKAPYLS